MPAIAGHTMQPTKTCNPAKRFDALFGFYVERVMWEYYMHLFIYLFIYLR